MVIPAISQAQNRPSNTGSGPSTLLIILCTSIPGLIGTVILLGVYIYCISKIINDTRTQAVRLIHYRQTEYNNNDDNDNDDNDDAAVATLVPQQLLAFSLPQTSELRQPVNTDSDSIDETVNDRSLSNQPPPSYYEVQEQGKALPSYTEAIQENRLQESVETINAAGPSEVTVAQEQRQLQETAATS